MKAFHLTSQFILICVLVLMLNNGFAQTTSWKGTTSASWGTASNWTAGVPTAAISAIIGDASFTGPNQPNVNVTANCLNLTIGGTVTSTLSFGVNKKLTVAGNLLINSNGTISHPKTTLTVKGNWTNNGTYTPTIRTAAVIFAGVSQSLSGTSATNFAKLTINAGSIVTLATNFSVSAYTQSVLTVSGTINPSESPTYTVTATALTVSSGGTIKVNASTFAGNYSVSGAKTLSAGSIVEYSAGSTSQTIDNTLTYSTLTISGSSVKTLGGNLPALNSTATTTGNIYVNSGTLDMATFTANRGTTVAGGTLSVGSGAFLKIGGLTSSFFPANFATVSLNQNSNVEYYGGGTQVISGQTYGNLILSSNSGAATKTMPATALSVLGNLTSNIGTGTSVGFTAASNISVSGNVTIGASTTFNAASFSHTFTGNLVNSGTLTGSTSTITLNGPGSLISGTGTYNFNNLSFTASGCTASDLTNITVAGNFSTSGSGEFTHLLGTNTFTLSGTSKTISGTGITFGNLSSTGTISSSNSFHIAGNLAVSSGSFTNTGGIIYLTGSSKTISGGGTLSLSTLSIEAASSITTAASFSINVQLNVQGSLTASSGTITFTGTSAISGSPNLFNVTINGTSMQLGSGSSLGVAGTFAVTAGSFDATSVPNTVNYNSSGAQNILATTYDNLLLSNGDTKSASGSITANNDLTIGSSTAFIAGTYSHIIKGDWLNSGTFTSGSSTVTFSGTSDAVISGANTFNILTINKSSSTNLISLNNNTSVATINMTQGTLHTGLNILTITTTRTGNGIITGTIKRQHSFSSGTNYVFEGPNNYISFTGASGLSSVTVKVALNAVADFPQGSCINREYEISGISGSYTSAELRLHYEEGELNGSYEPSLTLWKNSGSSWADAGQNSENTTDNYFGLSGITDLSARWTLNGTTDAIRWNGSVSSAWETESNWTPVTGISRVPQSTDIVLIGDQTFTNQPTVNSTTTIKSIQFGSAKAVTLSLATGANSTTLGNISGSWSANATHTIDVAAQTLYIQGDLIMSDGVSGHKIDLNIGTGTVEVTGSVIQTGGANITFSGAGTLKIAEDFNYTSGTFTPGSGTVEYNGTVSQSVAGLTYHHVTINKNSGTALLITSSTIGGNLSVTKGIIEIQSNVTITGNSTISSGANLITSGGININVGGNWTNSGTFTPGNGSVTFNGSAGQSIGTSVFNNLIISNSADIVSLSGDVTINGDVSVTTGTFDLLTHTVVRNTAGGSFSLSNGALMKVGGANTVTPNFSVFNIGTTSTIEYYGSGVQSISPVEYGHLVLSNGGSNSKTLAGNASVNGDITINSGVTFNADAYNIDLHGNWINNGGTFVPSTGAVLLQGSSKTITGTTTFNKVTVYGSYTVNGSDITYNGLLNVTSSGSLAAGSGTATLKGDLTNSGALSTTGTTTFSGTATQIISLYSAMSSSADGIVNFNGTVAPVLNSTISPAFANLNINNTGGVSPSVGWTVYGNFTIGSGASFTGGSYSHTFYKNFTNSGTITSSGTLNFAPTSSVTITLSGTNFSSTGTVILDGSGLVALAGTPTALNNLTITNTNASGITTPSGWNIGGTLTIGSGSTLNAGSYSYTAGNIFSSGTLNYGTSTFTVNAASSELSMNNATFYNFVINTGVTLLISSDFKVINNFTNNGAIDVTNSSGTLIMTGTGASIIDGSAAFAISDLQVEKTGVSGVATLNKNINSLVNLTIVSGTLDQSTFTITESSGNGSLTILSGGTLKIGGTNALPIFTSYSLDANSTVEYAGTTQSVTVAAAPGYGNLTVSTAGGDKTAAGNLILQGSFSLSNGTFAGGNNRTHSIAGNWTMSSGSFTYSGSTAIVFNGTANQAISSTGAFNNLTVNKATGYVTLGTDVTVNGALTFTSGNIVTSAQKVIIASTGSVSRTSGHVVGNLQKNCATGNNVSRTFEIGDATNYSPVTVLFANISVAGNLIASCVNTEHPNISTSGLDVNKSVNRYWTMTNSGITFNNYGATFTFVSGDIDGGANYANFVVRKYNSPNWTTTTNGTRTSTTTQATGITSFSDFAIGELALTSDWNGNANTVWTNSANWSSVVPGSSTNVTIPAGRPNYPNLNTGTGSCQNITIATGASVTVSGGTLQIAGVISNSGTLTASSGAIEFNSTSAQSLPASSFASSTIPNLIINNASGVSQSGNLTVTGTLTLTNGAFSIGANTLTLNGSISRTSGSLTGGSSSIIAIGGSGASTNLPSVSLKDLTVNRANGISLDGDVSVAEALTLTSGSLTLGTYTLTFDGTLSRTSGTITAGNSSTIVMGGSGSALTIPAGTFVSNSIGSLTINRATGVVFNENMTVNGVLNLLSTNPSASTGTLDMGSNTLTMGSASTTTGTGDVTGIIKRTSFVVDNPYSFGNQYTTVTFASGGTLPDDFSIKVSIGTAPSWKSNAIQREYDIIRTGGDLNTRITLNLHYLPSELNSNPEVDLVTWDYHQDEGDLVEEHGKSNQSTSDYWVGITNRRVTYFGTSFGVHKWSLAETILPQFTWQGTPSSDWNDENNWSGGVIPTSGSDVVIPSASGIVHPPTLPTSTTINKLTLLSGAQLNGGSSTTLTIAGNTGAWLNEGGTFYPETSTVVFTNASASISGSNDFYNLTINSGAALTPGSSTITRIAGTFTNSGTFRATLNNNTVDYNGTSQTVINPNGSPSGYHSLIISGSGTKTMPSSVLGIDGDFQMAGSQTLTAGNSINTTGNFTVGTGFTFVTGSYSHSIGGNLVLNGSITASGSTITMNGSALQTIEGTTTPVALNNLTISNSSGVSMSNHASVNNLNISSGALTLSSGKSLTAMGTTTLGSVQCLVLKSDASGTASFIDNGTISGTGTVKVERYLTSYGAVGDWKFHFLSSPVGATQAIQPEFCDPPNVTLTDFYKWNETTNEWINFRGDDPTTVNGTFGDGGNFVPGIGYLVAYPSDLTKNFTGTPYTSATGITLTCTNTVDKGNGWNLLGNPFPSAIDWDAVAKGNGMDDALYYYDNAVPRYRYYIKLTGDLGNAYSGGSRYIPAMQGFMVHANTTGAKTITMDNGDRVHESLSTYYKDAPLTTNILDLKVEGNNQTDYARVCFYEQANENFDGDFDAYKLFSYNQAIPEIYTNTTDNTSLAINTLPLAIMDGGRVPLNFKAGLSGNYTLTAEKLNSFASSTYIILEDKVAGIFRKLNDDPVYEFSASSQDAADRFVLQFKDATAINEPDNSDIFEIYQSGGSISIDTKSNTESRIIITNMLGQLEMTQRTNGSSTTVINTGRFQKGVYVISVITGNKQAARKLVIN